MAFLDYEDVQLQLGRVAASTESRDQHRYECAPPILSACSGVALPIGAPRLAQTRSASGPKVGSQTSSSRPTRYGDQPFLTSIFFGIDRPPLGSAPGRAGSARPGAGIVSPYSRRHLGNRSSD